jgi:hypothetical protein
MQYHQIKVKVNNPTNPSSFIGSALRGAVGHALKEKSCINPSYKCKGCFAKDDCLYYELYEESRGYRPFRFDVKMNKERYDFGLMLFFKEGRERDISMVIDTLSLMLNRYGLEKNNFKFPHSRFSIDRVFPSNQMSLPKVTSIVYLKSLTPFILRESNRRLIKEISLEDILRSIQKRKGFFEEGDAYAKLPFNPSYELVSTKSSYQKTFRRSDSQGKKIPVEGYEVEMILKNLDAKSYILLKYGEVVAVGNDTVRGYGRFLVEFK